MQQFAKRQWAQRLAALTVVSGVFSAVPVYALGTDAMANDAMRVVERYGQLPLAFEANQGQTDAAVKYLSRGAGYSMFLTRDEAVLSLRRGAEAPPTHQAPVRGGAPLADNEYAVIRARLLGANAHAEITADDRQAGASNYLLGSAAAGWTTNVARFGQVRYKSVYPGIDLVYHGKQQQLEYDFVVAPNADPSAIRMHYSGVTQAVVASSGDLELQVDGGSVTLQKPVVYQLGQSGAEAREAVDGRYQIKQSGQAVEVAFIVGDYDKKRTLVIDPVVGYSTYLGGSSHDYGYGIAVDVAGATYVVGSTASTNFPVLTPVQSKKSGNTTATDVFVTKFAANGATLVYSTYLGGTANEYGNGIAVDSAGQVTIAGATFSNNFPVKSALQSTYGGSSSDGFVAKLAANGQSLIYSTYLGGAGYDWGSGVTLDTTGAAYVVGYTESTNFPTKLPLQNALSGTRDAFVTKLTTAGQLVYSTYLGGSANEFGSGIAVNLAGEAYVIGSTASTNFPKKLPLQSTFGGGSYDAFITKLAADGQSLLYSSYLGGADQDQGYAIALDTAGQFYVTGWTYSTNFPLKAAAQGSYGGIQDAYISKFSADGQSLVYSTYLGGSAYEIGEGIAVNAAGEAYVTGVTTSSNFPTLAPLQAALGGAGYEDAFVTKYTAVGQLAYSTYWGADLNDEGAGITLDKLGQVYVTGYTNSAVFPTKSPYQAKIGRTGSYDAFVSKLCDAACVIPAAPIGP